MPNDKPEPKDPQPGTKPDPEPKPTPEPKPAEPAADIVVEEIDLQQTVENAVTRALDKFNEGLASKEEAARQAAATAANTATNQAEPKPDDKGKDGKPDGTTTEKPRSRKIRIFRGLPKL